MRMTLQRAASAPAAQRQARQRGGDAGEADSGDGVARRPAVDKGAAASGPRDAGGEAVKIPLVLTGCEESQSEKL